MREQPAPTVAPRSTTSTDRPRSLNSSAVVRPATPAPTTVTLDEADIGLPFLRRHDPDQVQRVQPLWLSQTGETGHPSDVGGRRLPQSVSVQPSRDASIRRSLRNRAGGPRPGSP